MGPSQGSDDHRTDAVSNGIAGQNQDRTVASRCRCKPDFTSLHPPSPTSPRLGPISDVGQRLLARVERVLGPSDRIVLAGQANEVAMKGLAQQFGPIDAEPLGHNLRIGRFIVVDSKTQHRHTRRLSRMTRRRRLCPRCLATCVHYLLKSDTFERARYVQVRTYKFLTAPPSMQSLLPNPNPTTG